MAGQSDSVDFRDVIDAGPSGVTPSTLDLIQSLPTPVLMSLIARPSYREGQDLPVILNNYGEPPVDPSGKEGVDTFEFQLDLYKLLRQLQPPATAMRRGGALQTARARRMVAAAVRREIARRGSAPSIEGKAAHKRLDRASPQLRARGALSIPRR